MKNKTTIISIIIVMQMLSACAGNTAYDLVKKPFVMDTRPPEGPVNYQAGWKDGCESGMAANNNHLQMLLGTQRFRINSNLQGDQLYNIAWQYAYNHCGYSMKALSQYSL